MIMDTWAIKRWIRTSFLGRNYLWHYIRYLLNLKKYKSIASRFSASNSLNKRREEKRREAWVKYRWNFEEFFLYDYENLTKEQISSFVSEYDKNIFCDLANDHKSDLIFHDKWQTYIAFQGYFHRDAILIQEESDLNTEVYKKFISKHSRFILKPVTAATGRGIRVIDTTTNDIETQLKPLLGSSKGSYIAEELIKQHDSLKVLHPASVNTLRITTFRFNDHKTIIIHPFLKIGQNGNFVDNGGQGGIICKINPDTGIIEATIDESLNKYDIHPNSGIPLIGFQIPQWRDAIATAKQLANVLPDVRYVGWDLALTDNGWVLVEGNEKGMFIGFQLPTHQGFRKEFNQICKEAGIKF